MTNWRAVLVGFAVQFVLGLLAFSLPGVGHAAAGLVGGFVAGWLAGGDLWNGAWHGLLAGALGGLVVASLLVVFGVLLAATGLLPAGILGLGVGLATVVLFLLFAVDSAVAGAVGALLAEA